jgi:5'-deoxynucleotidase YfbR-like
VTKLQMRETLNFIFRGGGVKRFHTVPVLREQTDADHSFGVAWICYLLAECRPSVTLLLAALSHDLGEFATGDMPSMIKRNPTIGPPLAGIETIYRAAAGIEFAGRLTEEEARWLDLADHMEGMMYCVAERWLGNRYAETWYARFSSYVAEKMTDRAAERELFHNIFYLWEEASACPNLRPINDK